MPAGGLGVGKAKASGFLATLGTGRTTRTAGSGSSSQAETVVSSGFGCGPPVLPDGLFCFLAMMLLPC